MARLAITDSTPIGGTAIPQFSELRRQFVKNFDERGDLGAACAVYHRGRKVVDLWGGYRDAASREPWTEDTLVRVLSTTKGLAAMGM
ncbi:MAG: serine hydrolase, partial [Planctomycetes bacterium]|nr:serine hydrolase [Planctomycetota bacterium]